MTENEKKLSQSKEKLLCCYHDSECGFFSSCYVKFFLKKNADARAFLNTLRVQALGIKKSSSDPIPGCPEMELWKRIEARIYQEEYAAKFQGIRASEEAHSWLRNFARSTALWGGASGALVTATIMFAFFKTPDVPSSQITSTISEQTLAKPQSAGALQAVNYSEGMKRRPIITESGFNPPSAIEVDWMRGNGPVRVVENPEERSALIWITKRAPVRQIYNSPYITEKHLPQVYSAQSRR